MDANVSTMTMPKTMPVQNLLRYIAFRGKHCRHPIAVMGVVDTFEPVWSSLRIEIENEIYYPAIISFLYPRIIFNLNRN